MKIHKPWWGRSVSDVILDVLTQTLTFTCIVVLLASGALVECFFPFAVWFFAGLSVVSVGIMAAGFIVMLIADASDTVEDMVDDHDD